MNRDEDNESSIKIEAPWDTSDVTKPSDFLKHVIAQLKYFGAGGQPDDSGRNDDLEGYLALQKTNDDKLIEKFFELKQEKRRNLGFGMVRNKDIIDEMKQKGWWE